MSMIGHHQDFEVLSGQTVRYDRKADSGNVIGMNFCALPRPFQIMVNR